MPSPRFFKAVLRSSPLTPAPPTTAPKIGGDFNSWVLGQRETNLPAETFAESIWYRYPREAPPPNAPITGSTGSASPPEASFIYLDVGAWVGSTDKPWGRSGAVKRDFGIVCGPHVLLCTFDYAANAPHSPIGAGNDAGWEAIKGGSGVALQSLVACLAKLSAASSSLGQVRVRRYLSAASTHRQWDAVESNWTIHVIVGDMHIPMMDRIDQARAYHAANADRVPRKGRVDLWPLETLVTAVIPSTTDTNGLDTLLRKVLAAQRALAAAKVRFDHLPRPAQWAAEGLGAVAGVGLGAVAIEELVRAFPELAGAAATWYFNCDRSGVENDTMSREHAEKWFHYYRDGVGAGAKPADIFENSGQHFLDFLGGLQQYVSTRGSNLPVQFHQLGDMLDYWVGFTTHFTPSSAAYNAVSAVHAADDPPTKAYGSELVSYWTDVALSDTTQGSLVATALDVADALSAANPGAPSSFLYGNHDCYLSDPSVRPTYRLHGTQSRTLAARTGFFFQHGVYMEHGHQWEDPNANNAGTIWGTRFVDGTDCPLGVFLTQAAFIRPGPVRGFEGKAAGAKATISGDVHGQRLSQMWYAAAKWVEGNGNFYVYAMGHTHDGALARIVVQTNATGDALAYYKRLNQNNPAVNCNILDSMTSEPVGYVNIHTINPLASPTTTTDISVRWRGLPAFDQHDWIQLEDPTQPRGQMRKGLWKFVGEGHHDGSARFAAVPPGRYVLRAYLDVHDTTEFRASPDIVEVNGISLEAPVTTDLSSSGAAGTPVMVVGTAFSFTGDPRGANVTWNHPMVIRWAFHQQGFPYEDAWFGLFRPSEPVSPVIARTVKSTRPWKHFHDLDHIGPDNPGAHPWWGRWSLDGWFLGTMAATPGQWELRAFWDAAGTMLVSKATFRVSRAAAPAHR